MCLGPCAVSALQWMSLLKGCPYFRGNLIYVRYVWDCVQCLHYRGYPYFRVFHKAVFHCSSYYEFCPELWWWIVAIYPCRNFSLLLWPNRDVFGPHARFLFHGKDGVQPADYDLATFYRGMIEGNLEHFVHHWLLLYVGGCLEIPLPVYINFS